LPQPRTSEHASRQRIVIDGDLITAYCRAVSRRHIQIAIGAVIAAVGVVLVVAPGLTRDILTRTPKTPSDWINLRATFGGTLVGLGVFVAWLPSPRPWQRSVLGLLLWGMAGIGVARLVGFAVDGSPDTRQLVWLVAEVVIVAVCAYVLRRAKMRS
jgi:hypothetical protein